MFNSETYITMLDISDYMRVHINNDNMMQNPSTLYIYIYIYIYYTNYRILHLKRDGDYNPWQKKL